jgi:hypothetical protein
MAKISQFSMRGWWGPLCSRPTWWVHSLAHWNKSQRVDMSLEHIILIPSQPVFALSPSCCVLSGEATNTTLFSRWFDPIGTRTYSLKTDLFSPWYSWKIAELALNNNYSLTHSFEICFKDVFAWMNDNKKTLLWKKTIYKKNFTRKAWMSIYNFRLLFNLLCRKNIVSVYLSVR